jgi:hypothetical protein
MNICLTESLAAIAKYVNVGGVLQNILFYGTILSLIYLNRGLIKQKSDLKSLPANSVSATSQTMQPATVPITNQDDAALIDLNQALNVEISSLKQELSALGEELELAYAKADRLTHQLSDIIDCLELSVAYDDHTWNWSIDALSKELTLSPYGSLVHGFSDRIQLPLNEALSALFDTDRQAVADAINRSFETGANFLATYRMTPSGSRSIMWVKSSGRMFYNAHGIPVSLAGKFAFTVGEPLIIK